MNDETKLSKKELLFFSLMFFSMFFGAGNLIFPPMLGQLSGTSIWISLAGFIVSAVGFPILAVIAVSKAGGLHVLSKRVHPAFGVIFTVLIYICIGPLLGIPRAASLAFEMGVAQALPDTLNTHWISLLIFTLVYFSIAFWLCLTPSKLVERFGKILTPTLLVLIVSIFVASLFNPLGNLGTPQGEYATSPFVKGFLEGYMTMDAIAALNYGIVISTILMLRGVKDEKIKIKYSIKAGLLVGLFLTAIYTILAYLGGTGVVLANGAENGAQTLTSIVLYLFGKPGIALLGIIFTLACLTTSVGLITSCSEYFNKKIPKISYKKWVTLLCILSLSAANLGLNKILAISVPILSAIYPMAIVLILLAILNKLFKGLKSVYSLSILFTGIISIVNTLADVFKNVLNTEPLKNILNYLPLNEQGMGWLVPALVGALIGLIIGIVKTQSSNNTEEANAIE